MDITLKIKKGDFAILAPSQFYIVAYMPNCQPTSQTNTFIPRIQTITETWLNAAKLTDFPIQCKVPLLHIPSMKYLPNSVKPPHRVFIYFRLN